MLIVLPFSEGEEKMEDEKMMMIRGKLNFFLDEKMKVHIFRTDRQYWNGILIEKKGNDVWVLEEDKFGKVHLFLCDVFSVSEFREAIK